MGPGDYGYSYYRGEVNGRSLAYLKTVPIEEVKGLRGKRGAALREAGVTSVADLLLHAPRRYIDRSRILPLAEVPVGEEVTVIGTVKKVTTRRPRRNLTIVEAVMGDGSSFVWATWFNQPFRATQLAEGREVVLSGKIERYRGKAQMKSPAVDVLGSETESLVTGRVVPIHRSIGPVAPGHMRRAIHNALDRARPISDPLPADTRRRLTMVDRDRAIADAHFPESSDDVAPARTRLIFDEFFRLEVALALSKQAKISESVGISHSFEPGDSGLSGQFVRNLPFPLTSAQERVLSEIEADLSASYPMHRLLQGEVGSGKTVVALAALLVAVESGYQGGLMAPTEVLAEQHFSSIGALLEGAGMKPVASAPSLFDSSDPDQERANSGGPVRLGLLTANSALTNFSPRGETSPQDVRRWVAEGEIDVVIGTHALIQEGVRFSRLGVAVVDEQHRFGVHQRVQLRDKATALEPDLLIMTATPIPRTLSMTLYGDLDVSLLDEMPPGRNPVRTRAVLKSGEAEAHDLIRAEVASGRQAFVVCPLVEDSPKVEAASATAEFERLRAVFADLAVGLLHGQLRPAEKEEVMARFRAGDIDVLVATTVIEVGIDVPNATVMVIEDAQRFGLSQLHQLRGRVGRGEHQGTCILIADAATDEAEARIAAMVSTTDGFVLAEEDLRIRGQGTVFGARQSGMADLRLADVLRDFELLVDARREAFALVDGDPGLARHPEIAEEVAALLGDAVQWLFKS